MISRKIKDYKPYKGFEDLREYNLTSEEFKKLWNIQSYLYQVSSSNMFRRQIDSRQLEKVKNLSAEYSFELMKYEKR